MHITELIEQLKEMPEKMEGVNSKGEMVVLNTHKLENELEKSLRNCDIGTAEEQERRWRSNCGSGIPNCKHCKVYERAGKSGLVNDKNMVRFDCRLIWAQMPYEEGETK